MFTPERQEMAKMCLRPQRGAFSGVLHAQTVASKKSLFYHSVKRLVPILLAGAPFAVCVAQNHRG